MKLQHFTIGTNSWSTSRTTGWKGSTHSACGTCTPLMVPTPTTTLKGGTQRFISWLVKLSKYLHVLLDEMGLDKMGLDKMGLDKMGLDKMG